MYQSYVNGRKANFHFLRICIVCRSAENRSKKEIDSFVSGLKGSIHAYVRETQYSLLKLIRRCWLTGARTSIIKIHAVTIDYVNNVCIEDVDVIGSISCRIDERTGRKLIVGRRSKIGVKPRVIPFRCDSKRKAVYT